MRIPIWTRFKEQEQIIADLTARLEKSSKINARMREISRISSISFIKLNSCVKAIDDIMSKSSEAGLSAGEVSSIASTTGMIHHIIDWKDAVHQSILKRTM